MKKLIFLLLISVSFSAMAQRQPSALYLSHQPVDFGIGVRGDYYINGFGLYSSVSYGNWGLYRQFDIKHHVKLSTGVLLPLPDYNGGKFDVTAGINYHLLGSVMLDDSPLNPKIFNPWSFELGLTVKLKRFAIGVRTDILRWEPCVDAGFKLFKGQYHDKN
ncbi:MAG: hypothetical protein JJE45_00260 [Prolixibacteraceae bacterium]|nr:hypothetical protein [Prolixibacteraceae bacterium]